MKNLIKSFILLGGLSLLASCQTEGCVTCEKQLPNSTTTAEICEAGSDITVRNTTIGVIKDETVKGVTVDQYKQTLITAGYTCK
jgi:hypothetical protein